MKAIVVDAPLAYGIRDLPQPRPPAGWALVRVLAAAFCATDLEVLSGGIKAAYPLTPGHEWCGVVAAVNGPEQQWLGQRVVGSNDVCCLTCPACRSGAWRNCAAFGEIGFAHNGAFAEYLLVPCYALRAVPVSITTIQAALLEPLGVALGTLDKAEARLGDTLLIIGAGSIGLNMLAAAKAAGLRRITVAASTTGRLAIAREMGASAVLAGDADVLRRELPALYPAGPDIIIDCTGSEACLRLALSLAPKGGRIALAGYGRGREMAIRVDDIHIKNLRVSGAGNNWNVLDRCLDLVADGLIATERLATDILPLEQFEVAVQKAKRRDPGFVKAVFDLGGCR